MKLVTFSWGGHRSIGKIDGNLVIDLPASDPSLPGSMLELLRAGSAAMERAGAISSAQAVTHLLGDVRLEAPIPNPSKYLAIGMNYRKHCEEVIAMGVEIPKAQVWFNKQVSCINGPYDPVHMPRVSEQMDYEAELAVVIGRRCRHVSAANAASCVAGYVVANDVSIRDWQRRSSTMTLGKSFDTHGPIGPWIVTADEIADPHALDVRMYINGEIRQKFNTNDMVYNLWQQIEHLSTVMTLEPGDLIATGTSSGAGVAHKPPRWVKTGDVMRVEIDAIGHIENVVMPEPL